MKQTKICATCKKNFITYHNGKYCGYECYWIARWGNSDKKCKVCGKKARFRYCSDICLKDFWNKNDYRLNKKRRMRERKTELILELGGRCKTCGISDIRILEINHIDRNKKQRPKNLHYTMGNRLREWNKNKENLELLCANCHRIHTWNQMNYGK